MMARSCSLQTVRGLGQPAAGDLPDVQADCHRPGEGDGDHPRRAEPLAECGSATGDEVADARRKTGLEAQAHERRRDAGCVVRRLEQNGVASATAAPAMPQRLASGPPRRNHDAHATRSPVLDVRFAGRDLRLGGLAEDVNLSGVESAEVNRLGHVGVGLSPVLAGIEDHERAEGGFVAAHQLGELDEKLSSLLTGNAPTSAARRGITCCPSLTGKHGQARSTDHARKPSSLKPRKNVTRTF